MPWLAVFWAMTGATDKAKAAAMERVDAVFIVTSVDFLNAKRVKH
jgi:hypothetical protein